MRIHPIERDLMRIYWRSWYWTFKEHTCRYFRDCFWWEVDTGRHAGKFLDLRLDRHRRAFSWRERHEEHGSEG